jgi:hypothetical protein
MSSKVCSEVYKGLDGPNRRCVLDEYHVGCCKDESGFKFIVEHLAFDHKVYWPNQLGNGPSGYPMNNEAFDKAAKKVLDSRKEDLQQAEEFMAKMARWSRTK